MNDDSLLQTLTERVKNEDFSFLDVHELAPGLRSVAEETCRLSVSQRTLYHIMGLGRHVVSKGIADAQVTHLQHKGFVKRKGLKDGCALTEKMLYGLSSENLAVSMAKLVLDELRNRSTENRLVLTDEVKQEVAEKLGCKPGYITLVLSRWAKNGSLRLRPRPPSQPGKGVHVIFLDKPELPGSEDAHNGSGEKDGGRREDVKPAEPVLSAGVAEIPVSLVLAEYDKEIAEDESLIRDLEQEYNSRHEALVRQIADKRRRRDELNTIVQKLSGL